MRSFTRIDIDSWERKQAYLFFKTFDIPFYNITANVDVTNLKKYCAKNDLSFFLVSLYLSQKTISQIDNFKLRIVGAHINKYNHTQAGSTLLLENNTFNFCYFDIESDLHEFHRKGSEAIEKHKLSGSFLPRGEHVNMIFYSVIPWVSFTSFQHARRFDQNDSIPRIVFGKYFADDDKLYMPVSVEVHHALVDGYHVGQYFEIFQKEINALLSN